MQEDVPNFGLMFFETSMSDSYGRPQKAYLMNRDGFTLPTYTTWFNHTCDYRFSKNIDYIRLRQFWRHLANGNHGSTYHSMYKIYTSEVDGFL